MQMEGGEGGSQDFSRELYSFPNFNPPSVTTTFSALYMKFATI